MLCPTQCMVTSVSLRWVLACQEPQAVQQSMEEADPAPALPLCSGGSLPSMHLCAGNALPAQSSVANPIGNTRRKHLWHPVLLTPGEVMLMEFHIHGEGAAVS